MNIQTCLDCNSYDDMDMEDSFMMPFGDDEYICQICAEARGVELRA